MGEEKIPVVEAWWRKWSIRLMDPDDMSRARRAAMYHEVEQMVSIRDRTIEALLTVPPDSPHLDEIRADAHELIGSDN